MQRIKITKLLLQTISLIALYLPAKSLTMVNPPISNYNHVMMTQTLRVASVKGNSTFFATDGFLHGFGYDLARSYATKLNVALDFKTYPDNEAALQAVKNGDVDFALTTASTKTHVELNLATLNLGCGNDKKLTSNGLHPKVSWAFANSQDPLSKNASYFLCDKQQQKNTEKLAHFYNQNLLKDYYNQKHFTKALTERLPSYKTLFQQQAETYNHDWQLLVAMGYQESHLNANAVSPTGVQGLMMLTNDTAESLGISNREDPMQSIIGGAKYLEQMKAKFQDVPNPDRLWFALASYNIGPNAIKRIQDKLNQQGKDGNSWANVYEYLSDNADKNSRYLQCMHYVSNIRSYLETIKTQTV